VNAQQTVDRLLEADEFNAREYFEKTPHEEFDEAAEDILRNARQLYAMLKRENIIGVAKEQQRGSSATPDDRDVAQAVLQLALEKRGAPGARRMYLRIKRYGRYII